MSHKVIHIWTDFKTLIDANEWFQWNFTELPNRYDLFGMQGSIFYITTILKDAGGDQTDFETNYKNNPTLNFVQWVESKLFGRKSNGDYIPLRVLDDGKLPIAATPPEPPIGTTPVSLSGVGNVSGSNFLDVTFLIPNGKTLVIQRFAGGAEGSNGSSDGASKAELFYDPNGNGTGMTLLRVAYMANSNFDFALNNEFLGNGIARIRIRRTRLDSGNREIAAFMDGFHN